MTTQGLGDLNPRVHVRHQPPCIGAARAAGDRLPRFLFSSSYSPCGVAAIKKLQAAEPLEDTLRCVTPATASR